MEGEMDHLGIVLGPFWGTFWGGFEGSHGFKSDIKKKAKIVFSLWRNSHFEGLDMWQKHQKWLPEAHFLQKVVHKMQSVSKQHTKGPKGSLNKAPRQRQKWLYDFRTKFLNPLLEARMGAQK